MPSAARRTASAGPSTAPGARVSAGRGAVSPLTTPIRPTGPESGRQQVEPVRIDDDADLEAFARRLLALFENPKNRQDLRSGRLRFTLAGGSRTAGPGLRPHRIDTGAVTERQVRAASEAGDSLLLGRRAVLTPLAREKARALGVHIEKER